MTLKIFSIPNIEKLTNLIEKSCGNVFLRLSDNSLRNLKNDQAAAAFLQQEADNCHGVEIHLSDSADSFAFLSFVMGGCA